MILALIQIHPGVAILSGSEAFPGETVRSMIIRFRPSMGKDLICAPEIVVPLIEYNSGKWYSVVTSDSEETDQDKTF